MTETKYKPEFCAMVVEFMGRGLPLNAFPGEIGVCRSTIYNWRDEHPAFAQAIELGRARQCTKLWKDAVQGLWIHKEGPNLNQNLWARIMLNCFPDDWVKPTEETSVSPDDLKALADAVKTLKEIE